MSNQMKAVIKFSSGNSITMKIPEDTSIEKFMLELHYKLKTIDYIYIDDKIINSSLVESAEC